MSTYRINTEMFYGYLLSQDGTNKVPLYCQYVSYSGTFSNNADVEIKTLTNVADFRLMDVTFLYDSYLWFNGAYIQPSCTYNSTTKTVTLRCRQLVTSAQVTATCNMFVIYSKG